MKASETVPIRNVYYLLCYAWNHLEALGELQAGAVRADRPLDFFARVLRDGTARRLRKGLDRSYVETSEVTARPRGRIDLARSISAGLLPHGRLRCSLDHLHADVLHNRVLRGTLQRLRAHPRLDRGLGQDLLGLVERMGSVSDVEIGARSFRRLQLHRNNADYAFLMNVCELVWRCLLADPLRTGAGFDEFLGNEQEMGRLFEAFVRNFLVREQRAWTVRRTNIPWAATALTRGSGAWLPTMQTDVTLSGRDGVKVVVECKFTKRPLRAHLGSRKLVSGHLYQLLSYLQNLRVNEGRSSNVAGVLLYAQVDASIRHDFVIDGLPVLVRSLDLGREWHQVHAELLSLLPDLEDRLGAASWMEHRDPGKRRAKTP